MKGKHFHSVSVWFLLIIGFNSYKTILFFLNRNENDDGVSFGMCSSTEHKTNVTFFSDGHFSLNVKHCHTYSESL